MALGYHIQLVGNHLRNVLWNIDNQGVVGHEAGVESGFLVVEEEFVDTTQVVTDNANGVLHICSRYKGILYGDISHTDIMYGRNTVGHFVFVGLVFA